MRELETIITNPNGDKQLNYMKGKIKHTKGILRHNSY